jgi:hypothetical protein
MNRKPQQIVEAALSQAGWDVSGNEAEAGQ